MAKKIASFTLEVIKDLARAIFHTNERLDTKNYKTHHKMKYSVCNPVLEKYPTNLYQD